MDTTTDHFTPLALRVWGNDLIQITLSKTFALLLIEVHEMIDNFSGIDTEGGGGTL